MNLPPSRNPCPPRCLASVLAGFARLRRRPATWPPGRRCVNWTGRTSRAALCVHVRDLGVKLYFSLRAKASGRKGTAWPRHFTSTAADFARLALRLEDPDTLFFNRRLLIEGDTTWD